jgi:adenylate kinase family enzyme
MHAVRAFGRGRIFRHHERVQRIAVVGCIGSGKSTAARTLANQLGLETFHLDRLWWRPGSYRILGRRTVAQHTIDSTDFRRIEEEIASGEAWIIDGDAANKDLRLSRADTVLFLDLPRWVCTWGLLSGISGRPTTTRTVSASASDGSCS